MNAWKLREKQSANLHLGLYVMSHNPLLSYQWEELVLVGQYLDPKSLAMASCVSKLWYTVMSSDYLWESIVKTQFPSLATVRSITDPTVSYCRLFAIGHVATQLRRQIPSKPILDLRNLIFTISITTPRSNILSVAKEGEELLVDPGGVFRFDIEITDEECGGSVVEGLEKVKIAWNVVMKGWKGVFTMMNCEGKVNFEGGSQGWFSEELPSACCCSSAVTSGIVADMKLGFSVGEGDGKVRVNKVCVGILSIVYWRYLSVDDGLRYLQHFLPNS